jgi:hypothetical protein
MYSTVNTISRFSYFDPAYPTSGETVALLARVSCILGTSYLHVALATASKVARNRGAYTLLLSNQAMRDRMRRDRPTGAHVWAKYQFFLSRLKTHD